MLVKLTVTLAPPPPPPPSASAAAPPSEREAARLQQQAAVVALLDSQLQCAPLLEQPLRLADAATGGRLLGPELHALLRRGRVPAATMGADGSGPSAPSFADQELELLEATMQAVRAKRAGQIEASLAEDDEPGVGAAAGGRAKRPKLSRARRVVDSDGDDDADGEDAEAEPEGVDVAEAGGAEAKRAGAEGEEDADTPALSSASDAVGSEAPAAAPASEAAGAVGTEQAAERMETDEEAAAPGAEEAAVEAAAEEVAASVTDAALLATAELYENLSCVPTALPARPRPLPRRRAHVGAGKCACCSSRP